ncbi:MAG: hypothetical protein ACTSWC_13670 [Promethearchaeota archaeon]
MVGRPRKPQTKIFRDFEIETPSGDIKTLPISWRDKCKIKKTW